MVWKITLPCPFGLLKACFNAQYILYLGLDDDQAALAKEPLPVLAQEIKDQLQAYFDGRLKSFTLPYQLPVASPFELRCWQVLSQIPYGETISYSQQASYLGDIRKRRAVAKANARNPLAIIIPCHRVIYACGRLGGYTTSLGQKPCFKKYLLELEKQGTLLK